MDVVEALMTLVEGLPSAAVYGLLGAGAAVENLFPPVPADTFVLLGGFLAGRGTLEVWPVFLVTWGCNVLTALLVYAVGHRYGRGFFEEGLGRRILTAEQLRRMRSFYDRWGTPAIFLARFLPGLRAVVPAFAGVSHQRFLPVAVPVLVASAIWYGGLVWVGATTARNLEGIVSWLGHTNRVLLALSLVLAALVGAWWYRSRFREGGQEEPPRGRDGGVPNAKRDRGSGAGTEGGS